MKTHLIWIPAVVALTAIACNGDETEDFPFFVPEKKPDRPLGPFKKHPLNPVINSDHETTLFPFREGVAALVIRDGMEHNRE